jgi:hypothetical protein
MGGEVTCRIIAGGKESLRELVGVVPADVIRKSKSTGKNKNRINYPTVANYGNYGAPVRVGYPQHSDGA